MQAPKKPIVSTRTQEEPQSNLEERIRLRAYELYEDRGREEGHDTEDWLQAEAELRPQRSRTIAA